MNQSRTMSLVESLTNLVAGFILALIAQILLFKALGLAVTLTENIAMTVLFSSLSLARAYAVRRLFNRLRSPYTRSRA